MFDLHGETVAYDTENNKLVIIDQTKLPNETVVLSLGKKEEIYTAIKELKLRGAPCIGVSAAIALSSSCKREQAVGRGRLYFGIFGELRVPFVLKTHRSQPFLGG